MKLYQLSNGAWIDLRCVTSINPLPSASDRLSTERARVVLRHGHITEVLICNDDDDAVRLANELATLVNTQ